MNILQVSTYDFAGGAEAVAMNLHRQYQARGHTAWLAVGHRRGTEPNVYRLKNGVGPRGWARLWWGVDDWATVSRFRGRGRLAAAARFLADPARWQAERRGRDALPYRGTWHLLDTAPARPDILHAHNLHGGYFDLQALPHLSRQMPVFLSLHDAWLLSGHCAHSFACDRWQSGCGACPDLSIPPAIRRDNTAENWQIKRKVYRNSRLFVATPCEWLRRRVEQSMLLAADIEIKIIPNGINLKTFSPADQRATRSRLGLPAEALILLFTANSFALNRWKDLATLRRALERVTQVVTDRPIRLVALGEAGATERIGSARVDFVAFQNDPTVVASYYQAADVYVHAAHADTFPNTILEALACGLPVVATAVGGIPEQVLDGSDGFLLSAGDAAGMAIAIHRLAGDDALRARFGRAGAAKAQRLYDLERQTDTYLNWYASAAEGHRRPVVANHA